MKKILLIGYNYAPEPTGIGKYSGEMIDWLARHGYKCTVLTAYPYYPFWKVQEPYFHHRFWYKTEKQTFAGGGSVEINRCPMYVPKQPSGLKRILLDLSFTIAAFFKVVQFILTRRFDMVVTVVPSFQFGLLGVLYKKLRNAKLLYHIQDLQIEAARDLKMIKSDRLVNTLFKVEKFIFNQCDAITCVGEGMIRKTQEKTSKKVSLFPNWSDIDFFHPLKDREALKESLGFKASDKIILYSGGIGEKQGLESILHAAKALEKQEELRFLVCGSGPYKEKLKAMAKTLNLKNLVFCPLQPVGTFNMFLNMADLHLVIQKATASDLVMPSKLVTILSVGGLALVTANKGSGLHEVVSKHEMGLLVEAENIQALIEGINNALSADHSQVQRNARFYAELFLSIEKVMGSFESSYINDGVSTEVALESKHVIQPLPIFDKNRAPWELANRALSTSTERKL